MKINSNSNVQIAVVGLGLMGSSIVVSLLVAGHQIIGLAPIPGEKEAATSHIISLLKHADSCGILQRELGYYIQRLHITESYEDIAGCDYVQECVVEDKVIKEQVYHKIASYVRPDAVIASNTSAIPISELQGLVPNPQRFVGVHWAEPAYMTRFLEITCGEKTDLVIAEYVLNLGQSWGKEPTLLKKDIRGFITNRLMYAVYREALTLIEQGDTTLEDADKVFRYDVGSWITLMGIFRHLDFMGGTDYINTYEKLIAKLSNRSDVPAIMEKMVSQNAKGTHNCNGLYSYTEEEAQAWNEAFARFNKDIYELASKYRRLLLTEVV